MKKLNVILLIFSFILSGIGGIFLFGAKTTANDSIQTISPSNKIESEEETEYTYKTFEDYYVDLDFSTSNITGTGSAIDPFTIDSKEEFFHLIAGDSSYLKKPLHNLPSEYTEVRYLRGTGTQYIDTGVALKQSIRASVTFSTSATNPPSGTDGTIFGAIDTANQIVNTAELTASKIFASHGLNDSAQSKTAKLGSEFNLEFREEGRWYWEDSLLNSNYEKESTGTSNLTMWLFGCQYDDGTKHIYNAGELSIHEFKFYDGSELIHHYIPCYRNTDTKPGMYDLITGNFLTNSGTGEFQYGFFDKNIYQINLKKSYIKLNCDIILNDETFDKDGNPSGGDGVIYNWIPVDIGASSNFDGNGHVISGMYINDPDRSKACLFLIASAGDANMIKNLSVVNFYLKAKTRVCAIIDSVVSLENCNAKGYLNGNGLVAGLAIYSKNIINCNNYSRIVASGGENAGMIFSNKRDGFIKNSNNYGDIQGGDYCAGFVANRFVNNGLIIENCNNYGNIQSTASHGAGILAAMLQGNVEIKNCANYGNIRGKLYSFGGAVGYCTSNLKIENFKNYGTVYSTYREAVGGIIGQIYDYSGCPGGNVEITNSYAIMDLSKSMGQGVFGTIRNDASLKCFNVKVDILNFTYSKPYGLCYQVLSTAHCELRNVEINVNNSGVQENFNLIYILSSPNLFIDNILVKTNFKNMTTNLINQNKTNGYLNIKNYLSHSPNGGSYYIGSNFSGFYFSWKTGQIGLVALDGRGQFQGQIDEEWLKYNGYEKKSV